MSIQSQKANMKTIYNLVYQDLSYTFGEKESGPNGAKKQFHTKSAAFLRALGNDLGLKEFRVSKNYAGIAVSGEITLMGLWDDCIGVYFEISQSLTGRHDFLYRSITHMRDSTGGQNQWMDIGLFKKQDYEKAISLLMALRKYADADTTGNAQDISAKAVRHHVA